MGKPKMSMKKRMGWQPRKSKGLKVDVKFDFFAERNWMKRELFLNSPPRWGMTLLEILTALIILAFAFIPIIGVIGTGATDTDVTNSYIFAQTSARNIFETLLDNVPFEVLEREGGNVSDLDGSNPEDSVARLRTDIPSYNVASFLALLGNPGTADQFARGNLRDERGTVYKTKLFIFPIAGVDPIDLNSEVTFRYLPRPLYENATNSSNQSIWYNIDNNLYVKGGVNRPYDYGVSEGIIATQTNAKSLGVPMGTFTQYCLVKKFLLRIRWVMAKGGERTVEVYTMKANLSTRDL